MHVYPPVSRFDFAPKHWRQRSGDQWAQDRVRVFVPDAERHNPLGNFTFKADSHDLVTINLPPIPASWEPAVAVTIKCPTVPGATAKIGCAPRPWTAPAAPGSPTTPATCNASP